MRRSHGKYSKQGRNLKSKGRQPISYQLKELELGKMVRINVNPRFATGMPHLRFNFKTAKVVGKQGNAYKIEVKDINKTKVLFIANVHLNEI
jgi:ribosomal protein L21E